jgi:SAM-dependent methyltransferase
MASHDAEFPTTGQLVGHDHAGLARNRGKDKQMEVMAKRKRTEDAEGGVMPQKKFYRMRAHINPLCDNFGNLDYPKDPRSMDWAPHYPELHAAASSAATPPPPVDFVDVGCGYGGLVIALATLFPENVVLGMEIRDKVTAFVHDRIVAMRKQNAGHYKNVSVVRTNSMKYMPNYFARGQVIIDNTFFVVATLTIPSWLTATHPCPAATVAPPVIGCVALPSCRSCSFAFRTRTLKHKITNAASSAPACWLSTPSSSSLEACSTRSPTSTSFTRGWSSTVRSILCSSVCPAPRRMLTQLRLQSVPPRKKGSKSTVDTRVPGHKITKRSIWPFSGGCEGFLR